MSKKLSSNQADILRFTEMHGQYTVWGIIMVLAARELAERGLVKMNSDDADENGIGHATVEHLPVTA